MKRYGVYITTNIVSPIIIATDITKTVLYISMTNDLSKRLNQHRLVENPTAFTAK